MIFWELNRLVASSSVKRRIEAARKLGASDHPSALPSLTAALAQATDHEFILALVQALGMKGSAGAADAILQAAARCRALGKKNYIDQGAADALVRIGSSGLSVLTEEFETTPDTHIRSFIADILCRIGWRPEGEVQQVLWMVAKGEPGDVTLGSQALELLCSLIRRGGAGTRSNACAILTRLKTPEALHLLASLLNDPEKSVRENAENSLFVLGAVEPLREAVLTSRHSEVRLLAILSLASLGAVEALLDVALNCQDRDVREQATFSLEKIGAEEAVEEIECDSIKKLTIPATTGPLKARREAIERLGQYLPREDAYEVLYKITCSELGREGDGASYAAFSALRGKVESIPVEWLLREFNPASGALRVVGPLLKLKGWKPSNVNEAVLLVVSIGISSVQSMGETCTFYSGGYDAGEKFQLHSHLRYSIELVGETVAPVLKALLDNPDPQVRSDAAKAIEQMTRPQRAQRVREMNQQDLVKVLRGEVDGSTDLASVAFTVLCGCGSAEIAPELIRYDRKNWRWPGTSQPIKIVDDARREGTEVITHITRVTEDGLLQFVRRNVKAMASEDLKYFALLPDLRGGERKFDLDDYKTRNWVEEHVWDMSEFRDVAQKELSRRKTGPAR